MRRALLLAVVAAGVVSFGAPSAQASLYCQPIGPVPGYGPVCTVRCVLGTDPQVDPKDLGETLGSLVPMCAA